jgi:hypothetical protein
MNKKLNSLLLLGSLLLGALPAQGRPVAAQDSPIMSLATKDDEGDKVPRPKTIVEFEEPEKKPVQPKTN